MDPKFSFTKSLFFNYKKIKAPENRFQSEWWIFVFNLTPFASNLFYFYNVWIRIRISKTGQDPGPKVAEYGSNLDPDPQHCYLGILFFWLLYASTVDAWLYASYWPSMFFLNLFIGFYFIIHTVLQCDLPSMLVMATSFKILGGLFCYGYILLASWCPSMLVMGMATSLWYLVAVYVMTTFFMLVYCMSV